MMISAAVAAGPKQYANPIVWADYSDPDVIRDGDRYLMVSSSFHLVPGIPVMESRDLVHWHVIGHVLPRLPFAREYDMPGPYTLTDTSTKPIGGTKYGQGVWAPTIRRHAGLFYVYFPTPEEGIFVSTAVDPRGPWSAPVNVIPERGLEDPAPLWHEDGKAWLIHGKVGAGPLILRRMAADGRSVLDAGVIVAEDRQRLPVLEGPKLYKRNGWYYIFAPTGGVSTGPQSVGRSRTITGPYEWRDVLLPTQDVKGPHQGAWIETPRGEGWFIHFNSTGAFGRVAWLEPLRWEDDWPIIGAAPSGAKAGYPVLSHKAPSVEHAGGQANPTQASDQFSSRKLGLQWQWNHNPDDAAWSLAERPGYLRLKAGPSKDLVNARNTLTQMLLGPRMTVTAKLDLSRMADGQRAGLTMFGASPSWIGAVREAKVTRLTFMTAGSETPGATLSKPTLLVRVQVDANQVARYAYSLNGADFRAFGTAVPLRPFSWWRGSRPGLFTFNRSPNAAGLIDVDWVRVKQDPM